MISLSRNEFNAIGFLIRNFYRRYTIRNIASSLNISSAGAHAALKKLEKSNIVKAEKLGTGLFYEVNLDNKAAKHLAAVALLEHFEVKKIDASELEKECKAAIFDGKQVLVVSNNADAVKDIVYRSFKGIGAVCKTEEELISALRDKEKDVLGILEEGNVLFGEEIVLEAIKRAGR